jgi:hypothetical protein
MGTGRFPLALGLAAAGLAFAAIGGGLAAAGLGPWAVEAGAQEAPRIRGPQEPTARGRAARGLVEILRGEVEVDTRSVIEGLPSARELAERRSEIAEELMEFALVKFLEPPSPSAQRGTFHAAIEDYIAWSGRKLDAALELADSDDDRRDATAREVAKLRKIEAAYRDLATEETIGVTPQNLMMLEFRRLELESTLARLVEGS